MTTHCSYLRQVHSCFMCPLKVVSSRDYTHTYIHTFRVSCDCVSFANHHIDAPFAWRCITMFNCLCLNNGLPCLALFLIKGTHVTLGGSSHGCGKVASSALLFSCCTKGCCVISGGTDTVVPSTLSARSGGAYHAAIVVLSHDTMHFNA